MDADLRVRVPPPPCDLSTEDVVHLADELLRYHDEFAGLFFRKEQRHWALRYLQGLLLAAKGKSAEPMALRVGDSKVRSMQQFLGVGAWDDEALLVRHAELVSDSLGQADGVLIVDGTDFPKKGRYSVGVGRQYCGATGKVDNCQASVFLGYASALGHTLVDRRLYLPQEWFEPSSRPRWERCGIPTDTTFRTKPALAWEMIESVQAQGRLPFSWVTADDAFGNNPEFLGHLEHSGLQYFIDVPVSTLTWPQRPATEVPQRSGRGPAPSRERLVPGTPAPDRADGLAAQLPTKAWRTYQVKAGEKGPIRARFAFVRAVAVRDQLPGPELWVIFRRSLGDPSELKVFLSNASAQTPKTTFVRLSGMRWPIETCFEQAKQNLGMAEYQTRAWIGWHHHMTLVILAQHFLVRMQLRHKKGLQR